MYMWRELQSAGTWKSKKPSELKRKKSQYQLQCNDSNSPLFYSPFNFSRLFHRIVILLIYKHHNLQHTEAEISTCSNLLNYKGERFDKIKISKWIFFWLSFGKAHFLSWHKSRRLKIGSNKTIFSWEAKPDGSAGTHARWGGPLPGFCHGLCHCVLCPSLWEDYVYTKLDSGVPIWCVLVSEMWTQAKVITSWRKLWELAHTLPLCLFPSLMMTDILGMTKLQPTSNGRVRWVRSKPLCYQSLIFWSHFYRSTT